MGVSPLSDLCSAGNVDALLYDVAGLGGISLLPESDSSSDKNNNSIMFHTDTLLLSHCIHMDTFFLPFSIIMT